MGKKVKSNPLLAIVGPTASGKTELGLKLARAFRGAVISADSRQIYRHASLGTNQPQGEWRNAFGTKKAYLVKKVPHFLINVLTPTKTYSAARFQRQANKLIGRLSAAKRLPILVGGTGLYVSAIIEGYAFPPGQPDLKLRKTLGHISTPTLATKLKRLDPLTHQGIDIHNRRRLIRALEHVITTGASLHGVQKRSSRPNTLVLELMPPRTKLRAAIKRRAAAMLKRGLLNEVRYLKRYYPNSSLLNTIGYQELLPVLTGKRTLPEAQQLITTHTWQYAKRQLTWFKRLPNVRWVRNATEAKRLTAAFLKKITT